MLFDLRARGRRNAIKVIYASLALLMGGGLVLFGIGGEVQGGLFDAFREENQQLDDDTFRKRAEAAEARARANPRDPAAWAEVARRRYQVAGENSDPNTGAFNEKGLADVRTAVAAWERHVRLAGDKADPSVARIMVNAYVILDQLDKAVGAQEVIVEAEDKPTSKQYETLAVYAYAAGQTRKGDLAAAKAVELAPKDEREALKGRLESAKSQGLVNQVAPQPEE